MLKFTLRKYGLMKSFYKIKGFTLAEILITLMIIGILAILIIPQLIQSWEERATVTKVKTFYSRLTNAWQLAAIENGEPRTWNLSHNYHVPSTALAFNYLKPAMRILQINANCGNCIVSEPIVYKNLSDNTLTLDNRFFAQLEDGSTMHLIFQGYIENGYKPCMDERVCGYLYYDVNGTKAPNVLGKDLFRFYLYNTSIKPEHLYLGNLSDWYCCGSSNNSSRGICSYWIIEKGNMDYIKKIQDKTYCPN